MKPVGADSLCVRVAGPRVTPAVDGATDGGIAGRDSGDGLRSAGSRCRVTNWSREIAHDDGTPLERYREKRPTRDRHLREELILAHLPLVRKLAQGYRWTGVEFDDLVQVGTIGLIKALRAFDPAHGVKFGTYAYHHVKGEIQHYLRDGVRPRGMPRWVVQLSGQLTAAVARLRQELGRSPTVAEVAARMNITEESVREILHAQQGPWLRLAGNLEGDFVIGRAQLIRDAVRQLPIEDRIAVRDTVKRLAAVQRKVVYYLFYMDLTQTQAAKRLGISQKHVSRVLADALRHLAGLVRQADRADRLLHAGE